MTQWEPVPVLALVFGMSRSAVRRDLSAGAFYIRGDGWTRVEPDDMFEAPGRPAVAILRHGKRDVRLAEFPEP